MLKQFFYLFLILHFLDLSLSVKHILLIKPIFQNRTPPRTHPVWCHAKRISGWGVRITMDSACASNEGRYWLESSQTSLTDVSGALRLPLVPHVQTGRSYRCLQFNSLTSCQTWSPTSSMESHHRTRTSGCWPAKHDGQSDRMSDKSDMRIQHRTGDRSH